MWLFIAIIAQIILGTSAVFDKLLLKQRFFDPFVYTFWIGIFGLTAFVLAPFGFALLPFSLLILALVTGAIFITGLFLLFTALNQSEASTIFTFAGSISPLATFFFAALLLDVGLAGGDVIGFVFLVGGGLMLFLAERKKMNFFAVLAVLVSALLFGLYGVFAKIVFIHSSFITGFLWIKFGAALCVVLLLLVPGLRKRIREMSRESHSSHRVFYISNMVYAGIGSALFNVAISLAHPALVDATQSFKYIVIFITAWLFLKERASGSALAKKIAATLLIVFGFLWLGIAGYARSIPYDIDRDITWGVTFSGRFSKTLGLDPRQNLDGILNDLRPASIRLVAYWDQIETTRGQFDFSELDWQLEKAAQAGTPVILAFGMKSPRWPECFVPAWASELSAQQREEALYQYIKEVVTRYRNNLEITTWQVENEPFLNFGLCKSRPKGFLEKEISLVRSLDVRPLLVSDGGEFGDWYHAAKQGDIFGTTMYRKVYPPSWGKYTGTFEYPIAPSFFRLKEKIVRFLLRDYSKPFVVIELQGEPWGKVEIQHLPVEEQIPLFTLDYFKQTIAYAKETGFGAYYLWGAEWWYFMGTTQNNWLYWNEAKELMRNKKSL